VSFPELNVPVGPARLRVFEVPGNPLAGAAHDAIDREVDSRIERIDQNLKDGRSGCERR
jgi:hypothetical protein